MTKENAETNRIFDLSEWPDAKTVEVEGPVEGIASSIILCKVDDGYRAYLNVCPHAGRQLDWAPGQFLVTPQNLLVCAAHGAAFELGSGECVQGPCRGEALLAVPIRIEGNAVYLED